jgi:hypothetical protein
MTSGEMPPADVPHPPTAGETAAIVRWLATRLEEGEAARLARRGRGVLQPALPANGQAPRLAVHEQQLDRVLFEQDIVAPCG